MLYKNILLFSLSLFLFFSSDVDAHGRLLNPPARSSCWREFGSKCKTEYTDTQMFCGGFDTQWNKNGGKCGICGDNWSGPRTYERGGSGYTGFIVRSYSVGQTIDVKVEVTANHWGWFEFRLCNADSLYAQGKDATQECLNQNLLKDVNGKTRHNIGSTIGMTNFRLVLPSGLSCNHCVFQWKYHTGNSWGIDQVTGQSGMGFGPQEEFYGCADVKIGSGSTSGGSGTITQAIVQATTQKPSVVTPSPSTSNKCPNGDGTYPDKSSGCRNYYVCLHTGTQYAQISTFTCPSNLLYDAQTKVCNYPNMVAC